MSDYILVRTGPASFERRYVAHRWRDHVNLVGLRLLARVARLDDPFQVLREPGDAVFVESSNQTVFTAYGLRVAGLGVLDGDVFRELEAALPEVRR